MDQQIKACNEVLTIYYELLEVIGTTPSLWGAPADLVIHQFPTDIEFVVDVNKILSKNLNKNENYLIEEFFFSQDFLDGPHKIQFAGIQARLGNLFIDLKIYPVVNYNRRNTD